MHDPLLTTCEELRELAETHPVEVAVILEMLIDDDEDFCLEKAEAA
jgi:hypothetical protein